MSEKIKKKLAGKIKEFFISLGIHVENFFRRLGGVLRQFISNIGNSIGDWVISLRNEQIKELEETIDNVLAENEKRTNELQEAAELVLDSEIELTKLSYENKILEDLAYSKMTQTLEISHKLALFEKEKEINERMTNEFQGNPSGSD